MTDLEIFWTALQQMWDLDRSAARGLMACRGLYVFTHPNALGAAPAHRLFERVSVKRVDENAVPRRFGDYTVEIRTGELTVGGRSVEVVEVGEEGAVGDWAITLTRLCE